MGNSEDPAAAAIVKRKLGQGAQWKSPKAPMPAIARRRQSGREMTRRDSPSWPAPETRIFIGLSSSRRQDSPCTCTQSAHSVEPEELCELHLAQKIGRAHV